MWVMTRRKRRAPQQLAFGGTIKMHPIQVVIAFSRAVAQLLDVRPHYAPLACYHF
jgi:hypothetical protein